MTKILDFQYFKQIDLWYHTQNLYYFSEIEGDFWKDFNLSEYEKELMKKNWKKMKTFYALSSSYFGLYGRGTSIVELYRNNNYPYETTDISSVTKRKSMDIYLKFKVFIYPFPDTTLLYISQKEKNIYKVILNDKETQNNKELLKKYNFLPSPENKNIVWYNRYNPFLTKFFYVYTEKPTYRYWEQNSENICLPSHNPNGFKSLSECSKNLNSFVKNKKVYVQTNSEPLHTISTTSIHPTLIETKNKVSVFDLFLIFLFLLVFFFERFL